MALPLLATAADLEDYGYAAIPDEVLHEMLLRASARVRRYTRQRITAGTSTVTLPSSPYKLPQRPVRAVNSVATAEGVPLGYTLKAGGVIEVAGCHDGPVVVDYDHGFETLPDELIELVCSIASRLASTPAGMHAGARTEQAGGESVTWGADAYSGTTGLTAAERAALDRIFPRTGRTVWLEP